jgi:hypothetical protein
MEVASVVIKIRVMNIAVHHNQCHWQLTPEHSNAALGSTLVGCMKTLQKDLTLALQLI